MPEDTRLPEAPETPEAPEAPNYLEDLAGRLGVDAKEVSPPGEPAPEAPAEAEAAEADPAEEPERPSIHERWRERLGPRRGPDPYADIRQGLESLDRRLTELSQPLPAEKKAPPVEQPEDYLRFHIREALGQDLSEVRSGLEEVRQHIHSRHEAEAAAARERAVVDRFEALENEYAAEVPGHRERFGAYLSAATQELVDTYQVSRQAAHAEVLADVQNELAKVGRLGGHPVAHLDREVSRYLDERGIKVGDGDTGAAEEGSSPPASAAPASRRVAERARAASSAAAGSMGRAPRAREPVKLTAKAVLRQGPDLSRSAFDRMVSERLAENGNNPHAAMDAVRRELYEAEQTA